MERRRLQATGYRRRAAGWRLWVSAIALLSLQCLVPAYAADYQVVVADPFLELHTGPGRGYPVAQVLDRGTTVTVLKRRTDWFKVRGERDVEGWVPRAQMLATLGLAGDRNQLEAATSLDFANRTWEAGVLAGDFGGASVISLYAGRAFTDTLSLELTGSQILGNYSNGWLGTVSLVHVFIPEWRIAPFFSLGTGIVLTEPKSTLVQTPDRNDQIAYVGAGIRGYLTRRFMARIEYRSNVVFTSRDDNEEIDQWQAGFAFFF